MKKLLLYSAVFLFWSCNKNDPGTPGNNAATVNGYWKGNTTTYGIGALLRSNGTARCFWNYNSLTLGDTSGSSIIKTEGTYIKNADSVIINGNSGNVIFRLRGAVNSSFSTMQGASSLGDATSIIVAQTFSMSK